MKVSNNKQIKAAYERYCDSKYTSLRDVYTTWSDKKEDAWKHCQTVMEEYNGSDMRIISNSGWIFTVGFQFKDDDGKRWFAYITPTKEICMCLSSPLDDIMGNPLEELDKLINSI